MKVDPFNVLWHEQHLEITSHLQNIGSDEVSEKKDLPDTSPVMTKTRDQRFSWCSSEIIILVSFCFQKISLFMLERPIDLDPLTTESSSHQKQKAYLHHLCKRTSDNYALKLEKWQPTHMYASPVINHWVVFSDVSANYLLFSSEQWNCFWRT